MVEYEKLSVDKTERELLHKAELLKERPYRRWSSNFGMIASLGGVIIVPILLGIWCGGILDMQYPQRFSWRLSLLFIGFAWGLFNAYMWIKIEDNKIEHLGTRKGEKNEQ